MVETSSAGATTTVINKLKNRKNNPNNNCISHLSHPPVQSSIPQLTTTLLPSSPVNKNTSTSSSTANNNNNASDNLIPSLKRTLSHGGNNAMLPSVQVQQQQQQQQQPPVQHRPLHLNVHPPPFGGQPPPNAGTVGGGISNSGSSSTPGGGIALCPPVLSSPIGRMSNCIGPPSMSRAVTSAAAFNRNHLGTRGNSNSSNTVMNNATNNSTANNVPPKDWRTFLSIEERQAVRSKIRDAYSSTCRSYEDLLSAVCAIDEELLHIAAPSRLDYFKSGFEFENRVKLKLLQIDGQRKVVEKSNYLSNNRSPTHESVAENGDGTRLKKPRK